MVEIFTVASGQSTATRVVSNELVLSAPSKIYFGSGTPGIAFFEKSGSDLKVTLLDGQEVMLRGFFGIGPAGEFSALLDGGAAGSVEVTGLIAPEPFAPAVAETAPTPVLTADRDTAPQAPVAAQEPEAQTPEATEPSGPTVMSGGGAAAVDTAEAGGGAADIPSFGGMGLDRILFAAGYIPALIRFTSKDDDTADVAAAEPTVTTPAALPAGDATGGDSAKGDAAAGAEAPAEGEADDGLPPEVAALLRGTTDGDSSLTMDLATGPTFAAIDDSGFGHSPDLLASLMDDLSHLALLG